MKAPNKGNHPCPILLEDGGDYIGGCSITMEITDSVQKNGSALEVEYSYPVNVDLKCPPLESMIDQGLAKIVLCLEQATIRRFQDYKEGDSIKVKPYELRLSRNLEVTPLIIACAASELEYDPRFMDPFYGLFSKTKFEIEPGQILAYGEVQNIKTNQVKGLSQIITFRELSTPDRDHPFTLDLSGDKIIVYANKEITQNIEILQSSSMHLGGLVNAALTYPIFYMVIQTMLTNSQEYSEKKWFVAIQNKINDYRKSKGLSNFEPESLFTSYDEVFRDNVWELTSQLLTDNNGQMLLTAFKDAGSFAGE